MQYMNKLLLTYLTFIILQPLQSIILDGAISYCIIMCESTIMADSRWSYYHSNITYQLDA